MGGGVGSDKKKIKKNVLGSIIALYASVFWGSVRSSEQVRIKISEIPKWALIYQGPGVVGGNEVSSARLPHPII